MNEDVSELGDKVTEKVRWFNVREGLGVITRFPAFVFEKAKQVGRFRCFRDENNEDVHQVKMIIKKNSDIGQTFRSSGILHICMCMCSLTNYVHHKAAATRAILLY